MGSPVSYIYWCKSIIWLDVYAQRVSSSLFNGHSDGVLGVPLLGEQVAVHYVEAIAVDLKIAADYQVLR
jgi:hypothetical protein